VRFAERILEHAPVLLDGGLGTALLSRGLARGTPPDRWNLERGEVLVEVHRAYVEAGSEAIHANTFGANPVRLAAFGLADRCEEINRAAVRHARAAEPRFVIADVGPTGEYLPPVGRGDLKRWQAAFECQAAVLADEGVDALHIETMSDLREALIALATLLSAAPGVPVIASMTFDRKKRGFFTVMGDPLVETLRTLASAGASAVGANCTITSDEMRELMGAALGAVDKPLVAQPNAGSPQLAADGTYRYVQPPDEFAADMATLAKNGVKLVGGCCGTDDRFIAALSSRLAVFA
jgi:Methionine synthase I (cobalamin-dependent), methyltransferase domain